MEKMKTWTTFNANESEYCTPKKVLWSHIRTLVSLTTAIVPEYVLNMWYTYVRRSVQNVFPEFVVILYHDSFHFESFLKNRLSRIPLMRKKLKHKWSRTRVFMLTQGIDGMKGRVNCCLGSPDSTTRSTWKQKKRHLQMNTSVVCVVCFVLPSCCCTIAHDDSIDLLPNKCAYCTVTYNTSTLRLTPFITRSGGLANTNYGWSTIGAETPIVTTTAVVSSLYFPGTVYHWYTVPRILVRSTTLMLLRNPPTLTRKTDTS